MLPTSMKAVRFFEYGEPSVLQYLEVPLPEMGESDILVKVAATSVNRFDLKMRRGQIPQIPGRDPFPLPFQPGRDMTGEVVSVGSKVTRFKVGDRVVGMAHPACGHCENCLRDMDYLCTNIKIPGHQTPGGYAEYVSRKEIELMSAPKGVPYEKLASCVWSYSCVWNIVSPRRGNLRPGQSVLITGASGGLGTAAIQLSRLVGASKIIATTGSPAKRDKLKQLGVDHVVNYHDSNAAEQVKSFTGGGVDLVIDLVGGDMFTLGLNCLRMAGTMVNVAGEEATNSIPVRVLTVMLLHRYVTIVGVRGAKRIDNQLVLQFLGEGKIDPVIDKVLPLREAARAHELLEKQEQVGKIVLIP